MRGKKNGKNQQTKEKKSIVGLGGTRVSCVSDLGNKSIDKAEASNLLSSKSNGIEKEISGEKSVAFGSIETEIEVGMNDDSVRLRKGKAIMVEDFPPLPTLDSTKKKHTAEEVKIDGSPFLPTLDSTEKKHTAEEVKIDGYPPLPTLNSNEKKQAAEEVKIGGFVGLFQKSEKLSELEKLRFFSEVKKGKLVLLPEDVVMANEEWKATMIGVVTGKNVTFNGVKRFVEANWRDESLKVLQKDNGVFIFKFKNMEMRDWVLNNGPWEVDSMKPMTLKPWIPGMPIKWESFDRVLAWICNCRTWILLFATIIC